ncbi:hypothetical protein PL18_18470 [Vibrio renipiscarius]|uniref:Uncharacterized protein n=1 Tax=Vibrio renipiscarius TaxID=1461322 RepID=A0A0C2NNS5_9VIBR|nr:hypothetical protein PL18_18470 [Vibrio renipiscarius]KII81853.1 hypothetical protein OJ16_01265 [Vibrio renipiscarius]
MVFTGTVRKNLRKQNRNVFLEKWKKIFILLNGLYLNSAYNHIHQQVGITKQHNLTALCDLEHIFYSKQSLGIA